MMDTFARDSVAVPHRRQPLAGPTARAAALASLTLGFAFDALFRGGFGLSVSLWIALSALNLVALTWRDGRHVTREAAAWLGIAIAFGCAFAWRNSDLQPVDLLVAMAALVLAGAQLRFPGRSALDAHVRGTVERCVRLVLHSSIGAAFVLREAAPDGASVRMKSRFAIVAKSAGLSLVVLLVFGSLLRGADPIFASFISPPPIDADQIVSHLVLVGVGAWTFAGWARSSLVSDTDPRAADASYPFVVGRAELHTVLGTVLALFAAYVATQVGYLFGGEAFLHARTGLTTAQYARSGFFQMAWVAALAIPLLVVTRGALGDSDRLARRHMMLALPIIGLLALMVASAALRMKMYVQYYGLTTDRFYTLVIMAWLAVVLLWLAATLLRGRGGAFVTGAVASALIVIAGLNLMDPDGYVARINVERSTGADAPELDLAHLANLGGGAVPLAVDAVLREPAASAAPGVIEGRCAAAHTLLRRFGPNRASDTLDDVRDWRRWDHDDAEATALVQASYGALIRVEHASCPKPATR